MSGMTDELVHYDVTGPLATITLDSPHNKNALSRQLVTELFAHLEAAEADADVRVVLVRSADRVFCSGADLSEATTVGMEEGARRIVELQRFVVTMSKPVVTCVLGAVRAGGIGLVAASDVAIVAEDAIVRAHRGQARAGRRDHQPHRPPPDEPPRRGADHAGWRGVQRHGGGGVRAGHAGRAGRRSRRGGRRVCDSLATGAAQGLRESKAILNRDLVARIDAHGEEMAALSARLFASDEAREAMTAFLNRKK